MNKKRWLFIFLVLVAGYFAVDEFKGYAIDYYADNYFVRVTSTPATPQPDQICLTWNADPHTTQAVQWRTATTVDDGWVEYREVDTESAPEAVEAKRVISVDRLIKNDSVNYRYTAVVEGLQPDTAYTYRVGSRDQNLWSDWSQFTTAPEKDQPFSFVYLGDAQVGLRFWGNLVHRAHERHPDARFYVIAGDLVNKGNWRNEWDEFFDGADTIFAQRQVVPTLGNHDYAKQPIPRHYLEAFALPVNGPKSMDVEHAYSLTIGNALFVVLDSNLDAEDQADWLDETLSESDATWKFAVYHHPAYASAPHRDNQGVQKWWVPLFERHNLDIALQGHDHAYLRTYPMKEGKPTDSNRDGVVYTVTVSGTKFYEQEDHDYAVVAFPNVATYQVIDIDMNPDRLTYKAYDIEGAELDEFVIEK